MPFDDWDDVNTDDLKLPIHGKTYRIPPIGYLDELAIRKDQAARAELLALRPTDDTELDETQQARVDELQAQTISDEQFMRMNLGPVLDEMRADNVPAKAIVHAAVVAHTASTHGRALAEQVWSNGLDPKALAEGIANLTKNLSAPTLSTPSPATESASETP